MNFHESYKASWRVLSDRLKNWKISPTRLLYQFNCFSMNACLVIASYIFKFDEFNDSMKNDKDVTSIYIHY